MGKIKNFLGNTLLKGPARLLYLSTIKTSTALLDALIWNPMVNSIKNKKLNQRTRVANNMRQVGANATIDLRNILSDPFKKKKFRRTKFSSNDDKIKKRENIKNTKKQRKFFIKQKNKLSDKLDQIVNLIEIFDGNKELIRHRLGFSNNKVDEIVVSVNRANASIRSRLNTFDEQKSNGESNDVLKRQVDGIKETFLGSTYRDYDSIMFVVQEEDYRQQQENNTQDNIPEHNETWIGNTWKSSKEKLKDGIKTTSGTIENWFEKRKEEKLANKKLKEEQTEQDARIKKNQAEIKKAEVEIERANADKAEQIARIKKATNAFEEVQGQEEIEVVDINVEVEKKAHPQKPIEVDPNYTGATDVTFEDIEVEPEVIPKSENTIEVVNEDIEEVKEKKIKHTNKETGANNQDPEVFKKYKQLLTDLYTEHAPDKLDHIDFYLDRYKGREKQFYITQKAKYTNKETVANIQESVVFKKYKLLLTDLYTEHDTEKLDQIDFFLNRYKGKEKQFYITQKAKYSKKPQIDISLDSRMDGVIEKNNADISMDIADVETLLVDILKDQSIVKSIPKLKITANDDGFTINTDIKIRKYMQNINISLSGNLENTQDSISVSGYNVTASSFQSKVETAIKENFGSLGVKIKALFEKTQKREIEKIQIEGGKLNIYFS